MAQRHKILLTGMLGQVGWELRRSLAPLGQVIAVDRAQLDLADPDAIRHVVREVRPTLIVNPAAYTAVDQAESEPKLAMAVNGIAPGILAEEAKRLGAMLVHYSTDYVFDGAKHGAYQETDATNPLGVYGTTKLAGEQAIQAIAGQHLIFRTAWVYGLRGRNFFLTMLRLAQEKDALRVVDDQRGSPTWSRMIAETTALAIARWNGAESGIYHLTCGGETSWYGFAQAILQEYQARQAERNWPPLKVAPGDIEAITTEQYPLPAKRPANSVLDNSRLEAAFAVAVPDWREALSLAMDGKEPLRPD
ncbi:MAG: dTDP-4-dehydrorhamnose reductase [Nitrosomonadales bacterium]|nr:MAG: dTDP-4-dehydrorhamnose reductase [Nitrosomonadales bacterium]